MKKELELKYTERCISVVASFYLAEWGTNAREETYISGIISISLLSQFVQHIGFRTIMW
jgi:hypothetical protein